jgi:hypothetical protein
MIGGLIMAKRFIDTTIWTQNKWFRKLESKYKLFWFYIISNCDAVGVWEEDIELTSFITGVEYDIDDLLDKFENQISIINDKKWLIVDFVKFQYGTLSKESRPHITYIRLIEKHGLTKIFNDLIVDKSKTVQALRKRLTKTKKEEILNRDELTCQYCSQQKEKNLLVVDHIISLSKGGNNEDENLITSCVVCNSKKNDHDVMEFINSDYIKNKILDTVYNKIDRVYKRFYNLKEKEKEKEKEVDKDMVKDKDKEVFEKFRKLYPGTKRGLETEYEYFKKQHKDWREILPQLEPLLLSQIEAKDQSTGFVPEWKNLKTYINNRAWEEEIQVTTDGKTNTEWNLETSSKPFNINEHISK